MLQLKRNLLSASLASAIALTASGVQAQTAQGPSGQETATTELDKVVVDLPPAQVRLPASCAMPSPMRRC